MNEKQIRIIRDIQCGLPIDREPYARVAERTGVPESEVISQLIAWKRDGTIRRVGAVLRHRSAGFAHNVMAVWNVPHEDVDCFARVAVEYGSVSHCYQRSRFRGFDYNLYTMIHGKSREECESVAEEISERTGVTDYQLLHTTEEFKKTSPEYFRDY
jgi:DNA-binding Lrp family transcriptional regulator